MSLLLAVGLAAAVVYVGGATEQDSALSSGLEAFATEDCTLTISPDDANSATIGLSGSQIEKWASEFPGGEPGLRHSLNPHPLAPPVDDGGGAGAKRKKKRKKKKKKKKRRRRDSDSGSDETSESSSSEDEVRTPPPPCFRPPHRPPTGYAGHVPHNTARARRTEAKRRAYHA